MADKTTGGLKAVKESPIGGLPGILDIYDDTLIPVEQQGEARHMKGRQFKEYAKASVSIYVDAAEDAADRAEAAVGQIGDAVEQTQANKEAAQAAQEAAEDAKAGAETAQEGAEKARDAIANMIVEAMDLPNGEPATVTKELVDDVYKLVFGLPRGPQGIQGPQGSSIASIVRTEGNAIPGTVDTYTITLTDGSTTTFQVYNGADGDGAGDMTKYVYDPQNRQMDIFKYVDDKIGDLDASLIKDIVTADGGGHITVADSIAAVGPYQIEMDEDGDQDIEISAADVKYAASSSDIVTSSNVQDAIHLLDSNLKTSNGKVASLESRVATNETNIANLQSLIGNIGSTLDIINGEVV